MLSAVFAACADTPGEEGPRVLELSHDTIRLESGVSLVDVAVRRSESGDFDPARVDAGVGDVVRFTAGDRGGHAISFEGASLGADARAWLEQTGQLRSPPLITSDAAWVITLAGAPPGDYPFRCTTHNATGHLTVSAR